MPVSFGELIALRAQAEIEKVAAASATSEEARPRAEIEFIEKLRSGDAAAFERFISERHADVYALLYRLTDDAEEARDLTQETFLQAFRHIVGFRGDADLRTWLYRIAVNQARNRQRWWRRRRRDATVSLDAPLGSNGSDDARVGTFGGQLPDETATNPERELLARERERQTLAALASLSRRYREAIVLRDIEGLSYEAVAAALQINVGTVKSRLARGRAELRKRLEGSL
jgi:RNA polymerase sigma-70 factor (ECF subfamily)